MKNIFIVNVQLKLDSCENCGENVNAMIHSLLHNKTRSGPVTIT